jgi:hypothetical protein
LLKLNQGFFCSGFADKINGKSEIKAMGRSLKDSKNQAYHK